MLVFSPRCGDDRIDMEMRDAAGVKDLATMASETSLLPLY